MVSPIIGGVLIDTFGWRSVFGFALLAGGAITLLAYLVMYETHPAGQPRQVGDESVAAELRRAVPPAALQRLRAAERLQHRRLHGDGERVGLADDRAAAPAGHRVRALLSCCFRSASSPAISSRPGSATAFSTETMVLAGSLLAIATVPAQAVVLSSGLRRCRSRSSFRAFFITMAQGIAMPYAQVGGDGGDSRASPAPRPASACSCRTSAPRCSRQLYGLLADGTPRPMIMVALLFGFLTLVTGCVPFLLKRHGAPPDVTPSSYSLMPARWITSAKRAVCAAMKSRNSSGRAERHGSRPAPRICRAHRPPRGPCWLSRLSQSITGCGRSGGRQQPEPGADLERMAAFGHRRHVGQHRDALLRRHAERAHRAGPDRPERERHHVEHHADMSGREVLRGGRRPAIRHVGDVDAGGELEQFAGDVAGCADRPARRRTACRDWPWRRRSAPAASWPAPTDAPPGCSAPSPSA